MATPPSAPSYEALHDPELRVRVRSRRALRYAEGADASLDRPGHVRAGSALAWVGSRLAVVQDDTNFVALLDPSSTHAGDATTALVQALALPAGEGGARQFDELRKNKKFKLDLEACVALTPDEARAFDPSLSGYEHGALIAFGSGSSPRRERLVFAAPRGPGAQPAYVRVVDAGAFYGQLRSRSEFSGSELNIEGVARSPRDPSVLVLVQRGNGAPSEALAPLDATAEVSLPLLLAHLRDPLLNPAPPVERVRQYALGALEDARLTFTDAVCAHGALFFLAAAEASPNAVDDGPVRGVALGVFAPDEASPARWARVLDYAGAPVLDKAEGLAPHPTDPRRFYAVIDRDEPHSPAELLELELEGPWDAYVSAAARSVDS